MKKFLFFLSLLGLLAGCGPGPSQSESSTSDMGRDAQGVRLIRLGEGERLVQLARIEQINGEDDGAGHGDAPAEEQDD